MANLQQYLNGRSFKPAEVPESEYELLPESEYVAMVTASEDKPTQKGNAIVLTIEIVEGKGKGRKLTEYLNVDHPNEKAVEIAYQNLAKLTKAVGKEEISDTKELHDIRFNAVIGIQKGSGTYIDRDGNEKPSQDQNRIKGYKPFNADSVSKDQGTQAKDANVSSPPWKK